MAGARSTSDRRPPRAPPLEAMIIKSDNLSTDIILRDLGGPKKVQEWLTDNQVSGVRVDRTIARLLSDRRDLRDRRDSSTPKAMVSLLQRLDSGKLLKPASRSYLLDLMARCQTGKNRMRGLLLRGTPVEHKTGTLNGLTTDVGFITLPDGRRLAIALFARDGTNRPSALAGPHARFTTASSTSLPCPSATAPRRRRDNPGGANVHACSRSRECFAWTPRDAPVNRFASRNS